MLAPRLVRWQGGSVVWVMRAYRYRRSRGFSRRTERNGTGGGGAGWDYMHGRLYRRSMQRPDRPQAYTTATAPYQSPRQALAL